MRRTLFAVIILTALTFLFFHKLAFTDLILARGDTYQYFYPLWAARDAALSQGRLPLWTPDVFMGAPLLSDPQLGTLYPPNWLTIGLPPPDAIRFSILLHVTWAAVGAFLLARQVVRLDIFAALVVGALYAFGGNIGAHVEQINQLHGLVWMPWAFLALALAQERPLRYGALLAAILALQLFSGHTQTVFMTVVGLGLYALLASPRIDVGAGLVNPRYSPPETAKPARVYSLPYVWGRVNFRLLIVLALAGLGAGILALPQLYPTLELTGLSNRGGGLNQLAAMAFSWNPLLAARGLLPSYSGRVFGEYLVTVGVVGLGLALIGAANVRRKTVIWLILALIGIVFALGAYTPVYWTVAGLPGFNLFRVPARWLALFALGAAMLAGIGAQTISVKRPSWRILALTVLVIIALMGATLLADRASAEVNGPALPNAVTVGAWAAAFFALALLVIAGKRLPAALVTLVLVAELFGASRIMAYNDLVDRAAFEDARMSVYQLKALYDGQNPPGRMLSISNIYFDPGDKSGLAARYAAMGMTQAAMDTAFTSVKLREIVAPNLPLVWNIPSIDGFGGGLVPTVYYTQFTSLMLPPGSLRTIDGRLRENLALQSCRGACIPEWRWLNLTNTRYLITDKTFDLVKEGIFFDTAFTVDLDAGEQHTLEDLPDFTADSLQVVYKGEQPPQTFTDAGQIEAGLRVGQVTFEPQRLDTFTLAAPDRPISIVAVSLVDSRTGDFVQVTPWRRVLSSDIKLYENPGALPRTFFVPDALFVGDHWDGTEQALELMRDSAFNITDTVVLSGPKPLMGGEEENKRSLSDSPPPFTGEGREGVFSSRAEIVSYEPETVEVRVSTEHEGYLFLSDAYYPGWKVTVNDEPTMLYRANVMFRAVPVPAGESTVVFRYQPDWFPGVFVIGAMGWLGLIAAAILSLIHSKL